MLPNFVKTRRGQLVLAAVLLAVLITIALLRMRGSNVYRALHAQTALVVEFNGLDRAETAARAAGHDATVQRALTELPVMRSAWNDARAVRNLFRDDERLHTAFGRGRLVAGFSLQPADSVHALFALDLGYRPDLDAILERWPDSLRVLPTTFRGHTLYTIYRSRRERFVVTSFRRMLLFSRYSYQVEDALNELDRGWGGPALDPGFSRRDDDALQLWFRPDAALAELLGPAEPDWQSLPARMAANVPWVRLGVDERGVDVEARTAGFLAGLRQWAEPPSNALFALLPNHTTVLAVAGIGRQQAWLEALAPAEFHDFDEFIRPWLGDEAAYVVTEPLSTALREDQFIVLAAGDTAEARRTLYRYGKKRGLVRAPEAYQTFELFEFVDGAILRPLAGRAPAFQQPCAAVIGRYVVFGGKRSALELWIDKYIVNQTLATDPAFLQLAGSAERRPGPVWCFVNTAHLPALVRNLGQAGPERAAADATRQLAALGLLSLEPGRSRGHTWEIAVQRQPVAVTAATTTSTSILWKTPLTGDAATPPCVVDVPREDAGALIFVQDTRHELYCLDGSGAVRWRRQLSGRLLSTVHGIDYLGNQTACLLFNTAEALYLLDENGSDLEGFPLQLQSPATNGVTVVDFDRTRQFSFFLACANGNAYGYDAFGRPLPGWNPQPGLGRVTYPLVHFQRDNKDYLVATNTDGRLFAFGRLGETRFGPVDLAGRPSGPPQVDAASGAPRIVCFDRAGRALVCNLAGETFALSLGQGKAHAVGLFTPLAGDARFEYLALQDTVVRAGGYAGASFKKLFTTAFSAPQDTLFAVSGNRFGTLSRARRQVWLFDGQGRAAPDFPLAGTTAFVVTDRLRKNREKVLVVGNGPSVYAYRVY